jgi:G3E family GTPase
MSLFDADKSGTRLPVSLITGFLGSGKTTLLNRLLKRPEMANTAVVINEFGDVAIDHLLVERVEGDTMVLRSGCICCTIRSDLEETLRDLAWRRRQKEIPPFDRVLIETTGLADPAPILRLLLNNPLTSHDFRLDAVVTTVDSLNALRQTRENPEAARQVAVADRLLLTKADIAGPRNPALEARLRALNGAAPIIPTRFGDVSPDRLFGAGPFDAEGGASKLRAWLGDSLREAAHGHPHSHHAEAIGSFCLWFDAPLDWPIFARWFERVRQARSADLLRVKGILNVIGEAGPVVVHGVHHTFHPPVRLAAWPDQERRSRLVVIGRNLSRAEFEQSWRAAAADAARASA